MPTTRSPTTSRTSGRAEGGTGLIGTLVGVTVFLVLLFYAVHLVLNLYATSVVTAAAFDAARVVAGSDGGPEAQAAAERQARELLDGYEGEGSLSFEWGYRSTDGDGVADVVDLHVAATHPTSLLPNLQMPYQTVDRTITVRLERLR